MNRLLVLLLIGAIASCATQPAGSFPDWPSLDDSDREWYASFLNAADQRALHVSSRKTIVRITWLRTFHNPVFVHVECGLTCKVKSVRLSGAGGCEPGHIVETNSKRLASKDKNRFLTLVTEVQKDHELPPSHETGRTRIVNGEVIEEIIVDTDGSNWVMEIVDSDGLEVKSVRGWQLEKMGSMKELCRFLIGASGIEIPEGEYY